MSKLIQAAIDIDFNARQKVEAAEAKKANLHEQLKKRKEKIRADYMKDVDERASRYVLKQEEALKERKEEIGTETQETLLMLQKRYEEEHDGWTDEIVKRVLSN